MPRSAERSQLQVMTTTSLCSEVVRHVAHYEEAKPEAIPARGDCRNCGAALAVDGVCPNDCRQMRRPKRYSW